jgi:FkbM family methyltransferase
LVGAGARLRDRLRIARILLYAHTRLGRARHVFGWIPPGADVPRIVKLRSGTTLLVRRRDAVPLYEQFALDSYGVELDARTIVDLGANVGFAAVALATRHPHARFVCVEPDPQSSALLQRNLELNGVDAVVLRAAVVGEPGRYAVAAGPAPASNVVERAAGGPVEGITLIDVFARGGVDHVDLLKVDIEGAEAGVFEAAAEWAPRVAAVVAELHAPFRVDQADQLLAPHGLTRIQLPPRLRFRDVVLWRRPGPSGHGNLAELGLEPV